MRVFGIQILKKLKRKSLGNVKLHEAIDQLVTDLEEHNPRTHEELKVLRSDADRVHSDGFYFFDIHIHRTMVLVELDEDGEATIVWAGSHDQYEFTFKNNRNTIEKWLRGKGLI